ncbi:type IV secretion system DNA-binding domain-containing protein [Patescibacteria group bacterium]|nr:type IV secretion system DNA-binding domain-containing protein [Patescibacteria group bacterium]
MVFLRIWFPKKESKDDRERESEQFSASKDFKEVVAIMTHFYEAVYSIYETEYKYILIGQHIMSFEFAVIDNQILFYIVVPRDLAGLMEKQITSFYPDSYIERTDDYNIFSPGSKVAACYFSAGKEFILPFKTYQRMNSDPLNNMTNVLSKLGKDEGAAVQIVVRAAKSGWQKKGREAAQKIFTDSSKTHWTVIFKPLALIGKLVSILFRGEDEMKENWDQEKHTTRTTPMTDEQVKAIEEKNTQNGFETVVRIVSTAPHIREAKNQLVSIMSAFGQYATTDNNFLTRTKYHSTHALVKNFMLRTLYRPWILKLSQKPMILCSDELSSLFHLPNAKYNKAPTIAWQNYKIAPPPANLPKEGLLLGHNHYRGVTVPIYLKDEDRFRHFYVIGQTGTGKSSILQVMIRQDLANGAGLCVVDPHGSLVEDILPFIPKERADDVIYFNPGDIDRPMGLNLLEATTEPEKDLVALEAMNIMIKLFDEETFGPRIQDYFRNGCLTLMDDPEGGALTDIVRLFTDDDFQKFKVEKVKNPIVQSFWKHQMAKTGAREKQEMIPYFASKFGQFVTNSMMRNIIGQAKSAFDFAKVMQEGKILLMNLSKGETGDINSRLLGLIITAKIQQAAMRRQKIDKSERRDFFLYIDEFQNYITDSIESILSEARKYRLGLILAHQYIAQLEGKDAKDKSKVKEAVFGNVGSMMAYKIGAQDAEYMAKEMAPTFTDEDLINIDKYKAVMKLSIDTQPSKPFSIVPVNPYTETGDVDSVDAFKQLSRLKYGRDKEFVEREILRRIGADI